MFWLSFSFIFKVTVLQCSRNTKINLYSKHRENKLQMLTETGVTYEWSDVQTGNLNNHDCHELRKGKLFLLLPIITTNKLNA